MVSFAFEHSFYTQNLWLSSVISSVHGFFVEEPSCSSIPLTLLYEVQSKAFADFGPKCRNSTYTARADYVML